MDKEHFKDVQLNWMGSQSSKRSWNLREFSRCPKQSKSQVLVWGRACAKVWGGKFTWSKETVDSQLSEGAVSVKTFRHTKFMFGRSSEDQGSVD